MTINTEVAYYVDLVGFSAQLIPCCLIRLCRFVRGH